MLKKEKSIKVKIYKSKMPISRQVRYYKESRDNWKKKATKKQKKLRKYVYQNRALTQSRDNWKEKAKEAEKRVKELEREVEKLKQQSGEDSENQSSRITLKNSDKIPQHHYRVTTIQITIQQIIEAGNSYRGVARTMKILSQSISVETPHYSSIRSWLARLGLYELKRTKEKREDWLYIVDLTTELGQKQALVVYGISRQTWTEKILSEGRALKQTDGEILALEITESATGEWIQNVLETISLETGIPLQIIADQGSNLKKGIQLYQQSHPQVINTYDVTHGMANLLKQELLADEAFQKFLSDCHQCRQQLQQTELAFAAPPAQRTQCRYFNLERLVNWAINILQTPVAIFSEFLPDQEIDKIEKRLKDKFQWLSSYQEQISLWMTRLQMTRTLEKQLKIEGLNSNSLSQFSRSLSSLEIPPCLEIFKGKIISYLEKQIAPIKEGYSLLATSDILESLFGRYKQFSQRCPLKDFRSMILTIPLATMNLTVEVVKQALSTISGKDLSEWINEVFGQSMLSQRQTLFSHGDMKTG
jgi:NAD-dependent SIR2 family protein deacetylase